MGRSKSSCFKIITCSRGDSADDDPSASPESKVSSDKHRWSFRKRASGYQVPSSTVLSEPISVSYNKENSEVTANSFHSPKISSVSEKALIKDAQNETPLVSSVLVKSEFVAPLIPDRSSIVSDHNIQESVAVVIQAFIRGYLIRRELHKLKNVIKLQAAVRGHLVRRQAVGTLRCIQAIIKMQVLIRARQARMFSKKLDEQGGEKFQMDMQSPAILGKRDYCMEPDTTKSLLSNGFARQLLESTPKTKPIYIKCDPSKSDSAWKWLERWMAVTLSEGQQERWMAVTLSEGKQEEQNFQGCKGHEENSMPLDYEARNDVTLAEIAVSSDSHLAPCESVVLTEDEMHLITENSHAFEFHHLISNPEKCFKVKDDWNQSPLENEAVDMKQEEDTEVKTHIEKTVTPMSRIPLQTDTISDLVHDSISNKPEYDNNLENHNAKVSHEAWEDDGKELVVGSKSCNTVLSAALSKSEDLTSTFTVGRAIGSSQDATADSRLHNSHFRVDSFSKIKDLILPENSFSHDSRVQLAASECGTEISISSTDRSEAEGGEIVLELGSLEKQKYDANGGSDVSLNPQNAKAEIPYFHREVLQPERVEECNGKLSSSTMAFDAVQVDQQSAEPTADLQSQAENSVNQQMGRSSPKRTPRSHTAAPELQGTPSSQNSVNAKKNKKKSRKSDGKVISQIGKKSPSNSTKDSGGRSSTEYLPKDTKNAKRRNSLGIAIPDHIDQEPRISTSSSLPSYMQATESARAKVHANVSPKSSPDLHNKDNHIKKRHSLPIANGKQGSPRIQRSTSQSHQSPKANGIHLPHNSAERRWQR